ncbi:hypothetical protein BDZ45DRAFT_723329 [Acephala macrosclerotiorum]|nr:hypothetical protein BDZ45DRAFT_723329 [Acephala macrosclerotiorum]
MSPEEAATPILVAKRQHKKSRNGCSQCKLRKVKCDEKKPLCRNCAKHYKDIEKCDFATSQNEPRIVPTRPLLTIKKAASTARKPLKDVLLFGLGSGIDPFECYPNSNVPNTQLLMHHYFQNFNNKTYPVHLDHEAFPIMQSVWRLAADDPVLFHATLQLSALDLELLRGGDREAQTKFLLNKECISLLRERVEDPVLGLSDQTIASVLFLIIVEFERSNFRMVEMHVNGLKRMVKLRGGLEEIRETNHMLANLIFGITLTVTTELQFIPETPFVPMSVDTMELAPNLRLFRFDNADLAKGHAQILRLLRYMTNLADMTWPHNAAPSKCSEILARVLALPVPVDEGPLVASVSESMRVASVALCFMPWKNNYPSPELMLNTMMHKLRLALGPLLSLSGGNHTLLPWLLSTGALVSELPERDWFIGHLVPVVTAMRIRSWEEMKSHLTKVLWMEYFCEVPFREIWEVVETKRNDLGLVDLDVW